MISRNIISTGLAVLLALAVAFPALAGGWAVITLDELPAGVVAGEPISVGFTVLQHGRTPMDGLEPTVTAGLPGEKPLVVRAEPDDRPGHYTAVLTFPQEGVWSWSVQAFTMDQRMPALTVAASNPVSMSSRGTAVEPGGFSLSAAGMVRALALAIGLVALMTWLRRKDRLAGALAGLCLVIGVVSFLPVNAASGIAAGDEAPTGTSASQSELGRQLFLAKGCITCHYNSRAADRDEYWTIEMGAPDLSTYSAHPEVLFIRLKDPAAIQPDSKMPDLGLRQSEIEALIAFINAK